MQRLVFVTVMRDHYVSLRRQTDQVFKQWSADKGHVACQHQHRSPMSGRQGSVQSGKRSYTRDEVGDQSEAKEAIVLRLVGSDQDFITQSLKPRQ
jgi:hypothetical protein